MARKISDRERLATFVLNATDEQLTEAKEWIEAALRQRAPKKPRSKSQIKRVSAQSAYKFNDEMDLKERAGLTERNPPPTD